MSRLRDPLILTGLALFAAAVLILGGLALRHALVGGAVAKVEARLSGQQVGAAQASGGDAVNTVASVAASEAAGDALTLENDRAIRTAPGAAAPVDPALARAGMRGLCRRAAYSGDQRCLQFTPAR